MKALVQFLFVTMVFLPFCSLAQLTNGGTDAYFGVDGDTRADFVKYGTSSGIIPSDDWFSASSLSHNVIDTSNAANYLSLLQAGANIGFNKRMSVPLYSTINGKLWLDAVYGRDYIASSSVLDSTAFTSACKNGDNPSNWVGGSTNFPDKNDLVDVFAHMRRDGPGVYDSLWLFTGVSTVGTSGSRYFDIELYKNNFSYDSISGVFNSAGTDAGHTQWIFDGSGNITQTGDMIIAVNFSPGLAPTVDVRIWVSQSTFASVTPAYFKFGANFDGGTPAFGYASILSNSGSTSFGSGISNYSTTPAQDTTYSTPWGTEQSTKNWGTEYQSLQLIEVGLNLTRIGLDPALYTSQGLSACQSLFSDIFFKSRSSNSFVSNLQDFVTPLVFERTPVMDYSLTPDTLRCNRNVGTIQITNNSTMGYYTWKTANGLITGSSSDSSQITVSTPGTYIVTASPATGCTPTRTDTVIIPIDTFPPVATAFAGIGPNFSYLQLFGGDVNASNYMTPFGGSQGLIWDWSGPNSFTSTIQNPITDTTWGTYQLIVTEKRNGCHDTAVQTLSYFQFGTLADIALRLTGTGNISTVELQWRDGNQPNTASYEIEKSLNEYDFAKIGESQNTASPDAVSMNTFSFLDDHPVFGSNYYRIKSIAKNGTPGYSNIFMVRYSLPNEKKFYIVNNSGGLPQSLVCNVTKNEVGKLILYNEIGQVIFARDVQLSTGLNQFGLSNPVMQKYSAAVLCLYLNNQIVFTQKVFF